MATGGLRHIPVGILRHNSRSDVVRIFAAKPQQQVNNLLERGEPRLARHQLLIVAEGDGGSVAVLATRTPKEVAAALGVPPKQLRDWLRSTYPRREDEWQAGAERSLLGA